MNKRKDRNKVQTRKPAASTGIGTVVRCVEYADLLVLTSPAIMDNGHIGDQNACSTSAKPNSVGKNISPPLARSGVPA